MADLILGSSTAITESGGALSLNIPGTLSKFEFVRTENLSGQLSTITWTTVAGSSKSYTPATGATYVYYQCKCRIESTSTRHITGMRITHDAGILAYSRFTLDNSGTDSEHDSMGWNNFDTIIPAWSGAKTTLLEVRCYSTSYEATLHRNNYMKDASGGTMEGQIYTPTEVTMYSIM